MLYTESSIEVDGKTFPNAYKADEYIERKIEPLKKRLASLSVEMAKIAKEKKKIEDDIKCYAEHGKKIQSEYDRDSSMSRKLRGPIGHDIDSEKRVKWLDSVKSNLSS